MIHSGLQKIAKAEGLKTAHGVAYGALRGYAATMFSGSNGEILVLSTRFADPARLTELQGVLNGRNIRREFSVQTLEFAPDRISILFAKVKKIPVFLDFFMPLLAAHSASHVNICAECGSEVTGGQWKLVDGLAVHVHESCGLKLAASVEAANTEKKENAKGSYLMGILGAALGSALGAVLWAVVLGVGYIASVVGLAIGWLANFGYNLLHGKQGKGKVAILIAAVIFGVLLGNFLSDGYTLMQMIHGGELPGFTLADIPTTILYLLQNDGEYLAATIKNVGMGLLFAGAGVYAFVIRAVKEVADAKIVDLE